jgi:hypothetical protein
MTVVNMPPTTTRASGCWAWAPIPLARAAGQRPRPAAMQAMTTGRISSLQPFFRPAADAGEENDGSQGGYSRQRSKAHGGRDAEGGPGEEQGEYAPDSAKGQGAEHNERVFPGAELDVQQDQNRYQAYGNDEGKTALLFA